jgi:hypothetical protein
MRKLSRFAVGFMRFVRFAGLASALIVPLAVVTAAAPVSTSIGGGDVPGEAWIALFPGDKEPILRDASVAIWDREEGVVIAGPSQAQIEVLGAQGIEPLFSDPGHGVAERRGASGADHLEPQRRQPFDHRRVRGELGVPRQHVRHPGPDGDALAKGKGVT